MKDGSPDINQIMRDGPIHGQSLTMTPGNAAWEHPPKYTDVEQALEFVYDQLHTRANLQELLRLLKKNTPIEYITKTILFAGFSNGLWTVDMAMLMGMPIMFMIGAIAKLSGNGTVPMIAKKGSMTAKQLRQDLIEQALKKADTPETVKLPGGSGGLMSPGEGVM